MPWYAIQERNGSRDVLWAGKAKHQASAFRACRRVLLPEHRRGLETYAECVELFDAEAARRLRRLLADDMVAAKRLLARARRAK